MREELLAIVCVAVTSTAAQERVVIAQSADELPATSLAVSGWTSSQDTLWSTAAVGLISAGPIHMRLAAMVDAQLPGSSSLLTNSAIRRLSSEITWSSVRVSVGLVPIGWSMGGLTRAASRQPLGNNFIAGPTLQRAHPCSSSGCSGILGLRRAATGDIAGASVLVRPGSATLLGFAGFRQQADRIRLSGDVLAGAAATTSLSNDWIAGLLALLQFSPERGSGDVALTASAASVHLGGVVGQFAVRSELSAIFPVSGVPAISARLRTRHMAAGLEPTQFEVGYQSPGYHRMIGPARATGDHHQLIARMSSTTSFGRGWNAQFRGQWRSTIPNSGAPLAISNVTGTALVSRQIGPARISLRGRAGFAPSASSIECPETTAGCTTSPLSLRAALSLHRFGVLQAATFSYGITWGLLRSSPTHQLVATASAAAGPNLHLAARATLALAGTPTATNVLAHGSAALVWDVGRSFGASVSASGRWSGANATYAIGVGVRWGGNDPATHLNSARTRNPMELL